MSCPECDLTFEELQPRMFSFNSPFGACEECHGLGQKIEFDPDLIIPDKTLSIFDGAIKSGVKIIDGLCTSLGIIEINTKIAKLAGLFINEYRKNSMVETADALIASSAKINNLMFWTFNKKHYPMFNKEELL